MKLTYDPTVDALTIRLFEGPVEGEVIRLNDRVAVDIGPGEQVVSIEILDASEVVPGLTERGVALENTSGFVMASRRRLPSRDDHERHREQGPKPLLS